MRTVTGERLNVEWGVGARQARYRRTGDFYMPLERFPGALCDAKGYVLFPTEAAYEGSPHLKFYQTKAGLRVNVPQGVENMPGYVKVADRWPVAPPNSN